MTKSKSKSKQHPVSSTITNEDYHRLFEQDPIGQRILEELTGRYCDGDLFNADPVTMAYNIGMRDVVRFIIFSAVAGRKENQPKKEREKAQLTAADIRKKAAAMGLNLEGEYDETE